MKQKVHLSPVSVLKPACCLDSSIKRPFYETALTSTRKGRKYPKSGSINSFRQSEFANQTSQTSKANSNSCLRWFSVPLLPKPQQGVNDAVGAMVKTKASCESTADRTSRVNDGLDGMASSVLRIHDLSAHIATAAEEQSAVTEEINQNMVAIRHMVSDLLNSGQQADKSTEALLASNERLVILVNRFKVR